jgi:hypothetical protein
MLLKGVSMRFIFNFIFFGILFYLIWMLFPDAFLTLVSWANHLVAFLKELIINLWGKLQNYLPQSSNVTPPHTNPAIILPLWLLSFKQGR